MPLQEPEAPVGSRTGKQIGVVPKIEPLLHTAFLANPGVSRYIFLLDLNSCPCEMEYVPYQETRMSQLSGILVLNVNF